MRGDSLKLQRGKLRLDIRSNSYSLRVVGRWRSCTGGGGVGGAPSLGCPELWRCGTRGHGQWAGWGWSWAWGSQRAFPT